MFGIKDIINMKNFPLVFLAALFLLLLASMPWIANQIFIAPAFANGEKADSVTAAGAQKESAQAEDNAVLEQLKTLLSENYCPNYDVKKWDFFEPAPSCLLEQAKKVAVAVFGPSEFSPEEEQKLRKIVANWKEVEGKWNEIKCKPGVVKKWTDDGQVDAPPECMKREAEMATEQARKNGLGKGQTIVQDHVYQMKMRHLQDMDRLNYLLAQVLSQYEYSCEADTNPNKDCVLNFYNSIKSKW